MKALWLMIRVPMNVSMPFRYSVAPSPKLEKYSRGRPKLVDGQIKEASIK
jgi:hypothetical protein